MSCDASKSTHRNVVLYYTSRRFEREEKEREDEGKKKEEKNKEEEILGFWF